MSPYFLNKSINVRRAELPYTLCAARVKPLLIFSQAGAGRDCSSWQDFGAVAGRDPARPEVAPG